MPSDGHYTAPRIAELTQLPVAAVKRILHSLACAKGRQLLNKRPRNNAVGDSDQFTTNVDFESKAAVRAWSILFVITIDISCAALADVLPTLLLLRPHGVLPVASMVVRRPSRNVLLN